MRRVSALALLSIVSCTTTGEGLAPPLDAIYFPTGLAISSNSQSLYVVNSDFDLQYNAGTLQSLDLAHVRQLIPRGCASDADCAATMYCDVPADAADTQPHSFWCVDKSGANANLPCGALGEQSDADRATVPGRCQAVDLQHPPDERQSLITDAVAIGAFATDVVIRQAAAEAGNFERIFIPVRGEATVNWADASQEGKLDCGQDSAQNCDQRHRVGRDAASNSRGLVMPPEPFAIDATADATAILVTHQTQGAVSLFVNDWQAGPQLEYIYSGLPPMPVATTAVPLPAYVTAGYYKLAPGFIVAYETTPRVDLFRYAADELSTPARPYFELTGSTTVSINSGGYDVRGLAIDDSKRSNCEQQASKAHDSCIAQCSQQSADSDVTACNSNCNSSVSSQLLICANIPLQIYASSRSPASLLIGQSTPNSATSPDSDVPNLTNAVALPTGPSRIKIAHIINQDNSIETRVLVSCFDSRRLVIFDPVRQAIEAEVTTGRGPQAIVEDFAPPTDTDEGHALVFVGHFTDSYVGVVELDRRRGRSYETMVLSLGSATPPRASK